MSATDREGLRELVRARYAAAAVAADPLAVELGGGSAEAVSSCCGGAEAEAVSSCCGGAEVAEAVSSCCGGAEAEAVSSCCGGAEADELFGAALYDPDERAEVPDAARLASLGCGNPTVVAELAEGERVLDLGSGAGLDVLLSARRVGPTGKAYGLDMTDEMLDLARRNAAEAGAANVEFLKGHIEAVPLPDASVDVVISNCVINLSVDKPAVMAETHRVLVPGGRIGITDVVAEDRLAPEERAARGSYVGCVAGALSEGEYRAGLAAAGFIDVEVAFTHDVADGLHNAIIRAVKPLDG